MMVTLRFCTILLLCGNAFYADAQLHRFHAVQPKMGSPFHLIFYADDSSQAANLTAQAFALVDSFNRIFSDYDSTSELSRLNQTAGSDSFVTVSPALYAILKQSEYAWQQSRGTFDVTIGPLSRLWRQSRKTGIFPPDSAIQSAKRKTGFQKIAFDTAARRVKLFQIPMLLDLGGIAKGYVAQQVVNFLKTKGIKSALADAGGDLVCTGAPPGKAGWNIGINVPQQKAELLNKTISLTHGAVATSGDAYQYTEHGGKKHSHIINPKTGYGVTFLRNVTVMARDGATADWLATACSILPVRKAKKLVRKKGAALLIGVLKNGRLHFYKTRRMNRYLQATG